MKKILLILSVFISALSFGQGKIAQTGNVIPTGLYPIVNSNNVKGTLHSVQSLSDMYAIPPNTRDTGMLCYVQDNTYTYQLFNGITNADWVIFSTGESLFDSIFVRAPLHIDTTTYPGHRIIYIDHADGIVSGGIVTWSGTGLKFYISPAQYWIQGKYYTSGLDSTTLATADPTYSRYDLFIVDTTGNGKSVTGTASMSPVVPQPDLGSQLSLTNAFLVNPGDTVPNNVSTTTVYNENLGAPNEWVSHTEGSPMTINLNNTDNPQKGTKDIFISKYRNGSAFYFNTSTPYQLSSDAVISGWIYLNGKLTNNIYAIIYNSITGATSNFNLIDSRYGINKLDSGRYQPFVIPTSSFTWAGGNTNNQFNTLEFAFYGQGDTSGAKGLYFDNITLQKGINNITPPTDYSNKLDSVPLHKYVSGTDTLNVRTQYAKGVPLAKDTIWTHSGGGTDTNFANTDLTATGDRVHNFNSKSYTQYGVDQYEVDAKYITLSTDNSNIQISDTAVSLITQSSDGLRNGTLNISPQSFLFGSGDSAVNIIAKTYSGVPDVNNIAYFDNDTLKRGHISISGGGISNLATGYGLSGGPITSTGTIIVDSAALSLKYVRISDTAAMLAPKLDKVNLNGGTTGQVLSKNSGTDQDYSWKNVSSGVLQSVISDTLKNYANSGSITTDNVLYSTPIALAVSNHTMTGAFALKSQSAYTNFGNRTPGSATPSFFINPFIDSIKLSTDTLFGRVNGLWVLQFKSPVFNNWLTNGTKIYTTATQVGIGVDTPSAKLTIVDNTITSALTNTGGLLLANFTPATVGSMKSSPSVVWESSAWNTNGAVSQDVKFRLGLKTLSGFGGGAYLTIETNLNNTGFNPRVQFGDGGVGASLLVTGNANVTQGVSSGFLSVGGLSSFSVPQSVITPVTYLTEGIKFNGGSINTNGTNTFNLLSAVGQINNTGGTNTLRFLYFNPVITSITGTTIISYQNEVGNNLLGTTSGSTSVGATTIIPASRIFQVVTTTQASSPYPSMTTTQRLALTPTESDGVYDLTLHKLYVYDGTVWQAAW
ncbi:MAG: hypothetical protein ABI091_26825 [Ferruginibacter sp.]